jgi:hypothetical protein
MTNVYLFEELPPYAEYINIQDEDEGRTMGIIKLKPGHITQNRDKLIKLLSEHYNSDEVIIRGHSWSSCSMMGSINYTSIEDGEDIERSAYFEITHIY